MKIKQNEKSTFFYKCSLDLVSFLRKFVSDRDIGSLHLVHASGTVLNSCLCISYLGLLHFETISTVVK